MTRSLDCGIAVVGCGAAAREFCLPALRRYRGHRDKVVLVDSDPAQARSVAESLGIRHWCTDYRSLPIDVGAALVTTPHHLHAEQSCYFLARGQDVFVEKPLGVSSSEAERMLATAHQTGATLMVNNYRRLFPSYARVHEMLASGHLGRPRQITIHDGTRFAWSSVSSFYLRDPRARGVLLDRGAHTVDIVCWWLGGRPRVVAARSDALGGVEAVAHLDLVWRDLPIRLTFSRLHRLQNTYEVECERGTLQGRLFDFNRLRVARQGRSEVVTAGRPCSYTDCAWRLVSNFVEVVHDRQTPLFVAADVAQSIAVIEEAYGATVPFEFPWVQHDPNLSSWQEATSLQEP